MRAGWRWTLRLLWRETLLPLLGVAVWLALLWAWSLYFGPPASCLENPYSGC